MTWIPDTTDNISHPYQDFSFPGRELSINDRGIEWGFDVGWGLELRAAPMIKLKTDHIEPLEPLDHLTPAPSAFWGGCLLILLFALKRPEKHYFKACSANAIKKF